MSKSASHFAHHVFFCLNQREPGEGCCADCGSHKAFDYTKAKVKSLGLAGPGRVRINKAGCLDRCDLGPVLVVYPEAVWYRYVDHEDLDEIVERHLQRGEVVERLRVE
jgi:(2Fe-2S) ferredoxin